MVSQILNMLNSALARCGQFFTTILNSSGMVGIFFSMLFLFFLSKFLLKPILGMGGKSDQARKSSGDDDE